MMAVATLGAASSCQKEIYLIEESDVVPAGENNWTFVGGLEPAQTKLAFNEDPLGFSWEGTDKVKILWDGGSTVASVTVNDNIATLSADGLPAEGTDVFLVCHGSDSECAGVSLSGGNLIIPMPGVAKSAPDAYLVAKAQVGEPLVTFRHPLCYYKLVVDGDGSDVTRLALASAANTITGTSLSLGFSDGVPAASVNAGGAASITFDFNGDGSYYFPFVPGETAANDLTFQFYRGEAKTEKAGALKYGAALANSRASVVNWASLPAMATNRYVSTSGSADNNGTFAKPWNFNAFEAFMENSSSRTDDVLALYDGVKINFANGTYAINTVAANIGIKVNIIGESETGTIFNGGGSKLIFDIYKKVDSYLFKNITFQNGKNSSSNDGGAFRVGSRAHTIAFENCTFKNNQPSAASKNGGVFNVGSSAALSFKDCTFLKNHATGNGGVMSIGDNATALFEGCTFGDGTSDNKNDANQGGVIYITNSNTVTFTDCVFNYNQGSANWGSCIMMYNSSAVYPKLYLDGCVFKNNVGKSRGVVACQNPSNALIFMNRVAFNNNSFTDTENDGWGTAMHCGNSVICMNNVTSFSNIPGNTQKSWGVFNSDGAWLMTNCTVVDVASHSIVRANNAERKSYLCNNIFINTFNAAKMFTFGMTQTSCGHNVISYSSAYSKFTEDETDMKNVTSLTGGQFAEPVYTWTNDLSGFSAADKTTVEAVYEAYDEAVNGVVAGPAFKAWLNSIGALGKDGRGETRTGAWWPGAYQN